MGDVNIDMLKYETCSYTQTLLQTMQSFSMFPVVDKPTRVYGNSVSYTHLRAHETDSYLVCRLLLEKKK